MRTVSTAQSKALASPGRRYDLKVEIKDSGGTWRDMASYPGFNAVESASWGEDVDGPHATAEVTLRAHADKYSVSPFVGVAAANHAFNPASAYAALIDVSRELRVSVAVSGEDTPVGAYDVVFHGRIDALDGAGDTLRLSCRALSGQLHDTWIEEERVYSFGLVSGQPVSMRVWRPSTVYSTSDYILPTEAKRNGKFYKCTTAGTSGTTEPTWPASGTVADGTCVHTFQAATSTSGNLVEKIMQSILNDNGLSSVVLYTPTASTWAIKQYLQKRESVFEALNSLAMQIGWQVRYKYRSGTGQFELTFFQPDRTKSAVDQTFSAADYSALPQLALDISSIRNALRVVFPNAASLDPAGNPQRTVVDRTDSASIARYGRRFMEISEADSSQIDSNTEATAMADAALADLKDPVITHSAELLGGFHWVELGDLYTFAANSYSYDANQTVAVYSYRHECSGAGRMTTRIDCRGKPSGAYSGWFAISNLANPEETTPVQVFTSGAGLVIAATAIIGGARITCTPSPERATDGGAYEYHVSASSGFTPSSSTLKTVSKAREIEVTDLTPGTTYYAKVVPSHVENGRAVRAFPSEQVSFVAGRGVTAHLNGDPEYGRYPLNGGFETRYDTSGPPDHWTMVTGAWGTDYTLVEDGSGLSGDKYLRVAGNNTAKIRSADFLVEGSRYYTLSFLSKSASTLVGCGYVKVQWLDSSRANISTAQKLVPNGTSWQKVVSDYGVFVAPSNARFAYVFLDNVSTDAEGWVDQIRLEPAVSDQEAWHAPVLQNSWVDYGAGYTSAGYRRDSTGRVHLRGLIKDGTATVTTLLFTLPSGYAPSANHIFATRMAGPAACEIRVNSDGTVRLGDSGGHASWTSLDGISFSTD